MKKERQQFQHIRTTFKPFSLNRIECFTILRNSHQMHAHVLQQHADNEYSLDGNSNVNSQAFSFLLTR